MSRSVENEDMPPSYEDLIHSSETAVQFMVCAPCRANGLRGHMPLAEDELHWVCPECGHSLPTIKQLMADTRNTLEEGRREFEAGEGQRRHL